MNNVNHPDHYSKCSLKCIEVMRIAFGDDVVYDFCMCNAFKYLWRYKFKGGIEDLEKAEWYVDYTVKMGLYGSDPKVDSFKKIIASKVYLKNNL